VPSALTTAKSFVAGAPGRPDDPEVPGAPSSPFAPGAPGRPFLRGCDIVAFTPAQAHAVGALRGAAGAGDVVDAHVVLVAGAAGASVLTSDKDDLSPLSSLLPSPVHILPI
jgi:hypothetical protein